MYTLYLYCDMEYPDHAPNVRFVTRVNMKGVSSDGLVGFYFLTVQYSLSCNI